VLTDPEVIAKVPLSARQAHQIVQLCVYKQLTKGHAEAQPRVLSALVKKGFAAKVDSTDWQGQDTWAITEAGRIRCTSIY
jgi:hypothetical protein